MTLIALYSASSPIHQPRHNNYLFIYLFLLFYEQTL